MPIDAEVIAIATAIIRVRQKAEVEDVSKALLDAKAALDQAREQRRLAKTPRTAESPRSSSQPKGGPGSWMAG